LLFLTFKNKELAIGDQCAQKNLFLNTEHEEQTMGSYCDGFNINDRFLIFWNHFMAWYLELSETSDPVAFHMKEINFLVDPNDYETFIRKINTSSDPYEIVIKVRQSVQEDCIILWDLLDDVEIDSFDTSHEAKVFYDKLGDSYITEGNNVIVCKQNVKLSAYEVGDSSILSKDSMQFDFSKGHRFDHKFHNWILFYEHIALSYSFMTFVIRGKSQEMQVLEDENYLFDRDQYNFIINRRTCFTCDHFAGTDYARLEFILRKLEENDIVLIEQIQYYYLESKLEPEAENLLAQSIQANQLEDEEGIRERKKREDEFNFKITPLLIAYREKNNRSINILLKYMSKIEPNCSGTFKEILPYLVNQ